MILERKQRGNRTYLTFFLQKKKKIRTQTLNPSLFDREIIQNNIFIQETFVASWKTMFFDRKLLLLHSIKKRNYLLRSDFVNFWSCFASWYSQTNAFQAPSSLNTPCGISSGSSPLLLASASLNQALLS